MGETAVKSHVKGKLHISRVPNETILSFFPRNKGSDSVEKLSYSSYVTEDNPSSCSKDRRVDSMVFSNDTIKAEIIWVLKIVIFNFSMNSYQNVSNLFAEMFICPIADAFKLSPTKC